MSANRFLDELHEGVLLGDGAIGTELFARGAPQEKGIEHLNTTSPDLVLRLHQDYVASGSRVIETNTFAANRPNLAKYNLDGSIREILLAGVGLARKAAGSNVYVAASVGPLPTIDGEPFSDSQQREFYLEQIQLMLEGGVDLLIFESFSSLRDLLDAISVGRSLTEIPIVAQMAFGPDAFTDDGDSAHLMPDRCRKAGADVVGANCGYGLPSIVEAIEQMNSAGIPMSAYMNAGFPERVEGRLVYNSSNDYLAAGALQLIELGVRLIGGCCGTGPETIRAIRESTLPARSTASVVVNAPSKSSPSSSTADTRAHGKAPGRILVELDPPTDLRLSPILDAAAALKDSGIDAITVADNPLASVRVDTLTVAARLQGETGIPAIPHLTGRDRNRIALQSTIMGAHMLGIRYLLCVTGDPIRMCQDPNTSGVFDVNSIGLVRLVANYNAILCESGSSISVGVALNPNVRSLAGQISKLHRKIEAGADYVLTQPVFSKDRMDILQEALSDADINIPVYVGVLPLSSAGNARFLHNEVPGIFIPDSVHEKLAKYGDVADQRAVATELCTDLIEAIAPSVHGFYMITPRNRVELVLPLVAAAREMLPRGV